MTYAETDIVTTIERLAGTGVSALTPTQLDGIDQFHAGGAEAVERLIPGLRLTAGMAALDVGSGLGGPARQIAQATGCVVVGVDITPAYVEAARSLTDAAGLADQVRFFCGDIAADDQPPFDQTAFEQTAFDAAYSIHVQMNIADKKAFYTRIARRLRPGGRLATFEVCRSGEAEPALPLPWSLDGADSHLVRGDELRDTIAASGFEVLEWADETGWARQWFEDLGRRLAAAATPATLPALLTDGRTRMLNFAVAVSTAAVTIHRGAFALSS